jgi:hypothetical protein
LVSLPALKDLRLSNNEITDDALAIVNKIKPLESLCVVFTPIGDEGLDHITDLPNLRFFDLDHTHVTREGVWRLQERLNRKIVVSRAGRGY